MRHSKGLKILGLIISIWLLCMLVLWAPLISFPFLTEPESVGLFPHEPMWIFQAAERIIAAPVVVQDKWIIVRTAKGIYWLDAEGMPLQRVEVSGSTCLNCFNSPPVLCGEWLLVPEGRHALSAFFSMGALAWRVIPSPGPYGGYIPSNAPVESIACGEGIAYAARYNWDLTAYELLTGNVLWESSVPDRSTLSLATDGRIVYLGANIYIKAYDGFSGDLIWSEKMGTFVRSIQLVGKTLYVGLFKAPFLAIDVDTRSIRWQADFPAGEYPFLIDGNIIYITNQEHLAAISREDGQVLWQRKLPNADLGTSVVAKGVLYIRDTGGYLYALEVSTGRELGGLKVQSDGPFIYLSDRGPAVVRNLLLVPFGDNRLLAYPLIDPEKPLHWRDWK